MRISNLFRGRWVVASFLGCILLSMGYPAIQTNPPIESSEPTDKVDSFIRQLYAPEGKVKLLFTINPGGPVFEHSAPMLKLVEHGNAIQPRLLTELKEPRVRNEVALILAQIGDKDALPHLIEFLPTKEKLTDDEAFSTTCLLYALWQLTGMELGIHHKFSPEYTPAFRTEWQVWYESNKDYLYTPSKPKQTAYSWGRDKVLVDVEAKLAGRPTSAYRKENPWVTYEDIKTWRDGPAYERKLKDFCFSVILNLSWNPHGYAPREAVRALGRIRDPRALAALHKLCMFAEDIQSCHDLIWTLEEIGDPSSIPVLEKIPRSKVELKEPYSNEPKRLSAIAWIRLLDKYGKELKGKPFDIQQATDYVKCLESSKGVEELLANLRNRENDSRLLRYLEVAGYIDQEPVRSCLKQMASDKSRDDLAKTRVHASLARLGEKESVDQLKRALTHKYPSVRLAAAESLWQLGNREGVKTLVDLLDLRLIESGGEGVQVGDHSLTVNAVHGNLDYIRSACKLLGEIEDRSAVEPLKGLLPLNLNGVLATGGSGSGWSGRPDAVALARLGDFSGIAVLRASISKGDPLDVVGSWRGTGDFVEIGLKRFIPEILPMFENRNESKRVQAAQAILLLLESGR